MFDVFTSIWTSAAFSHDGETSLDYNVSESESDGENESLQETPSDSDFNDDHHQALVYQSYSLDYMKKALEFYGTINPRTGRRAHRWKVGQHRFQRIPHQSYMARFRQYVDNEGTKRQKLDDLEDIVNENVVRSRGILCPVHGMDLKRWAMREARNMELTAFVASNNWVMNFKRKHDICSRKIIKVREVY